MRNLYLLEGVESSVADEAALPARLWIDWIRWKSSEKRQVSRHTGNRFRSRLHLEVFNDRVKVEA